MKRESINAKNAPAPRGGYSQAVKIEDFKTLFPTVLTNATTKRRKVTK